MKLQHSRFYKLILLKAKIRQKKGKRTFVLTALNTYPKLSLEKGLLIIKRCGLPLWASDGLNQASFIGEGKHNISCYQKSDDEILVAQLGTTLKMTHEPGNVSIYPDEPDGFCITCLSGFQFSEMIGSIIRTTDIGLRLGREYAEEKIHKARLSLVPKGWKPVTDGTIQKGDRYYNEDGASFNVVPSIVGWMDCDVSFSAHKPGTPVKRYDRDDTIIIRKAEGWTIKVDPEKH